MSTPSLENLFNYLEPFYKQLPINLKDKFSFKGLAEIYTYQNKDYLFAQCEKYMDIDDLIKLPKGLYLCSYVREETRKERLNHLLIETKNKYK